MSEEDYKRADGEQENMEEEAEKDDYKPADGEIMEEPDVLTR